MIYKQASIKDIDEIINLRVKLLIEEGISLQTDIKQELIQYFNDELNKTIIVMVAEENSKLIATSSVIFQKYPPSFSNKQGMRAYIANVYTLPEYRRKGINTVLLDKLIEKVKDHNISYVWLWATEEGKKLYKKYGFDDLKTFTTMDYSIY